MANRQGLFAYVRTCKTRLDTTTNCSILSFHSFHYHPLTTCMKMAVDLSWWFQQRSSNLLFHQAMNSLFQHAWTSLSTTLFKLASSTMSKPVNSKNKLCVFTCAPNVNYLCLSIRLMIYFCWIKFEAECKTLKENLETLKHDHERLTAENNKLRAQVDGLLALKKVAFYFKIFYLLELNQKWLVNVV